MSTAAGTRTASTAAGTRTASTAAGTRPGSTARGLYLRFRQLIHEAAKFGVVGVLGVVVNIAGADLLHYDAGLGKYTALTLATVAATVLSFLGNRYWTFSHREGRGTGPESVMFFALNGIALLIQYATLWAVDDGLRLRGQLWYTLAVIFGIGLGTLFRFWSYRKWVWRAVPAMPGPGPGPWTGPRHARPSRQADIRGRAR